MKEDDKILAHVDLSAEFRELLERAVHENLQVEFALRLHGVNGTIGHPAENPGRRMDFRRAAFRRRRNRLPRSDEGP